MFKTKRKISHKKELQRSANYANSGSLRYSADGLCSMQEYLFPLITQLRAYDEARLKLETRGGDISDIKRTTSTLNDAIKINDQWGGSSCTLSDQRSVSSALSRAGLYDVHLQVRKRGTGMPVYYLCRTRQDYFSEYSLIVEDLYLSKGYPMVDERFVRLMNYGHESAFLRLSPFRGDVILKMADNKGKYSFDVDDALYHVGRHVFQAAWHDDQRPGMQTSLHFDLPCFQQAIELLYLSLSGDLCEIRNALDERLLLFFENVYPQPSIRTFLGSLNELNGTAINELPRSALKQYVRLSGAFSSFLNTEVPWGREQIRIPLYKLIFANFSRLAMLASQLKDDRSTRDAAHSLEKESQQIIEDLLVLL